MKKTKIKIGIIFWYLRWFLSWIGIAGMGFNRSRRKKIQRAAQGTLLLSSMIRQPLHITRNLIKKNPEKVEIIFEGVDLTKRVSKEKLQMINTRIIQTNFLENK